MENSKQSSYLIYEDPYNQRVLTVGPHTHEKCEVLCNISSEMIAFCDKKTMELHAGDVFIVFPHQIHDYHVSKLGKMLVFQVAPKDLPPFAELFNGVPDKNLIEDFCKREDVLRILKGMLEANKEEGLPTRELLMQGYMLSFFSLLFPTLKVKHEAMYGVQSLQSILNYCHQHYTEKLSLDLLSKELELSKFYISHIFGNRLSLSFNDYVNSLRISEACKLLCNGEYKIAEVASKVGFSTLRTFNRAFLKEKGMTPTEYRELVWQPKKYVPPFPI